MSQRDASPKENFVNQKQEYDPPDGLHEDNRDTPMSLRNSSPKQDVANQQDTYDQRNGTHEDDFDFTLLGPMQERQGTL